MKDQKRIHICYIITRGDWGGAQRYVFDLVQTLQSTHQISIIIGGNGVDTLSKKLQTHPNIQIISIPTLGRAIHPVKDLAALVSLNKTLKQLAPDIIHLNSTKAGILGSIASSSVPHAKVIYTVHGWVFNEPTSRFKRRMYLTAEKYTQKQKDAYIVLSDREKQDGIQQLGIPNNTFTVIPNGLSEAVQGDTELHQSICRQFTTKQHSGAKVFLTIANFYHTKGVDILIDAVAALPKDTNAHFYIAGDGPLRPQLTAQIAKQGLQETITLLGEVTDASALLPLVDCSIMPSRKEGLSYVLLESLQAGTPIIATEVGANNEVFAASSGVGMTIVPSEDTAALSEAIALTLQQTKEEVVTLPPIYSLERMADATVQLYRTLLH